MITLLIIIYITFISLGLPDALLGSAWPAMYQGLGVPIANAGFVSMIISGGTIISSFASGKLIKRFGIARTTIVSVAMTAIALTGISFSSNFWFICLWAIPLGLGGGTVDSALNNFVALHYEAKHMNWLHCFWGIGASLGPIIMSLALSQWQSWNLGYRIIGVMQIALVIVLFLTLHLWKRASMAKGPKPKEEDVETSLTTILSLPGAKETLGAFFCYCAIEATMGLWGSSYLVTTRNIAKETAASWVALYYGGITIGRFLSGFLAIKFSPKQTIRMGQILLAIGVVILLFPLPNRVITIGFLLIGLGCAPIFPSLLHETPRSFGVKYSQAMVGVQMGCAFMGSTFMPPLFGLIATKISYKALPLFLGGLLTLMVVMVGVLYQKTKARRGA